MIIKTKTTWKDYIEKPKHKTFTRREFLERGLATGFLSMGLSQILMGDLVKKAQAADLTCPAPVRNPGAIAQIFSSGGPTMGARFISEAQASMMNATMAAQYGLTGQANLVRLGPNLVVDSTSVFGFTLLQGPPGYVGGPAAWRANVLSKLSAGGHLGPFNQDDGAGVNTGLLGGMSPFKASQMGKDLKIGVANTLATWANGLPGASVSRNNLSATTLGNSFSLTPAATGLVNSETMTQASDTSSKLSQIMGKLFKTAERKGASNLMNSAGCAFYGNSALADPNYGTNLFTASRITALTSRMTVANLTAAEQAQAAAFYQSALGVAGGVVMQFNGRDYHDRDPQTVIGPADLEEARTFVMFLAACEAANAPGALIYLSNGQAIASGVQQTTHTINGVASNVQTPIAEGDAGGAYNAGLIIFYSPSGAPPAARYTGTISSTNGNAKVDPNVGSSREAVAGLYLSALQFIGGGRMNNAALAAMQAQGVAKDPSKILVI